MLFRNEPPSKRVGSAPSGSSAAGTSSRFFTGLASACIAHSHPTFSSTVPWYVAARAARPLRTPSSHAANQGRPSTRAFSSADSRVFGSPSSQLLAMLVRNMPPSKRAGGAPSGSSAAGTSSRLFNGLASACIAHSHRTFCSTLLMPSWDSSRTTALTLLSISAISCRSPSPLPSSATRSRR